MLLKINSLSQLELNVIFFSVKIILFSMQIFNNYEYFISTLFLNYLKILILKKWITLIYSLFTESITFTYLLFIEIFIINFQYKHTSVSRLKTIINWKKIDYYISIYSSLFKRFTLLFFLWLEIQSLQDIYNLDLS